MTTQCNLNRVMLYPTFLSARLEIREANMDEMTLWVAMEALRQALHTGVALSREGEEWGL